MDFARDVPYVVHFIRIVLTREATNRRLPLGGIFHISLLFLQTRDRPGLTTHVKQLGVRDYCMFGSSSE